MGQRGREAGGFGIGGRGGVVFSGCNGIIAFENGNEHVEVDAATGETVAISDITESKDRFITVFPSEGER